MRHKAHFCAYELLASRLSTLLDVSQCDKKKKVEHAFNHFSRRCIEIHIIIHVFRAV